MRLRRTAAVEKAPRVRGGVGGGFVSQRGAVVPVELAGEAQAQVARDEEVE